MASRAYFFLSVFFIPRFTPLTSVGPRDLQVRWYPADFAEELFLCHF